MKIFRKKKKYLKIEFRLLFYFTSFTVCSGDIEKSSENDELTGHFQSFFFRSPTLNLKKTLNQLIFFLPYKTVHTL